MQIPSQTVHHGSPESPTLTNDILNTTKSSRKYCFKGPRLQKIGRIPKEARIRNSCKAAASEAADGIRAHRLTRLYSYNNVEHSGVPEELYQNSLSASSPSVGLRYQRKSSAHKFSGCRETKESLPPRTMDANLEDEIIRRLEIHQR